MMMNPRNGELINVAVGKKATQSSLSKWSKDNDAERALNDLLIEDFAFHTEKEECPWWMVDLLEPYTIKSIVVHNRRNKFFDLARTLKVEVSIDGETWRLVHAGLTYWKGERDFPLDGKVIARYVRLSLEEFQYLHLARVEVLHERFNKWVIAHRSDGLGERLNALVNGIYLSRKFGYKLGFIWKNEIFGDAKNFNANKNVDGQTHLIGHAIGDAEELFSKGFIKKYSLSGFDKKSFLELSGKKLSIDEINKKETELSLEGWLAPRLDLRDILNDDILDAGEYTLRDAFNEIEFSPKIARAIELANNLELGAKTAAIHLRSGDVFYGEYRKWVHYSYKGITLPIAKAIIKKLKADGYDVLVFGQDVAVLKYLKSHFGLRTVDDVVPEELESNEEQAMFEILLMSRANVLVAGSSGFAKFASWIGNSKVDSPHTFFDHKNQTQISVDDLLENGHAYHPLQTAFAYWYAYHYGRHSKTRAQAIEILSKAYEFDPNNQLYPLVISALLFKDNLIEEGNAVLQKLVDAEWESQNSIDLDSLSVLTATTLSKFNLEEYFPYFEDAAEKGSEYALLVDAVIKSAKGDNKTALSVIERVCRRRHENDIFSQIRASIEKRYFS